VVVDPDPFAIDGSAVHGSDRTAEGGNAVGAAALDGEPGLGDGSGAEKSEAEAQFDASTLDAPMGFPQEAGAEGAAACDLVSQCCSELADAMSPETVLCLAGVAQTGGGEAGACESVLAIFTGAGLCPSRSSDGSLGP
jgi:hypothetical protein